MSQTNNNTPDRPSNSEPTTPFIPPTPVRPLPSKSLTSKFPILQEMYQQKQQNKEPGNNKEQPQHRNIESELENAEQKNLFPIDEHAFESHTERTSMNTDTTNVNNATQYDDSEDTQAAGQNTTFGNFTDEQQRNYDHHVFQLENTNASLQLQIQQLHAQLARAQYDQSFYHQNMQQASNSNLNFTKQLCKPDEFKGDNKSDTDTWVSQMRNYLYLIGVPPQQQVPFVSTYLKGAAATWYNTLHLSERSSLVDFESLSKLILARFRPLDIVAQARRSLQKLTQTGSVSTFNEQFMKLMQLIPTMNEEERVNSYRTKLKFELQKHLVTQEYARLTDIMNVALRTDALLYEHNMVGSRLSNVNRNKSSYVSGKPRTESSSIHVVPVNNVKVDGVDDTISDESKYDESTLSVQLQYAAPSRMDDAERQRCREQHLCFRCRNPGHVSRSCPIFKSGPSSNRLRPSTDISSKKY
jgi:hypothetical protein